MMLREMELTYVIKDEMLLITTVDQAETPEMLVQKVYPVADLVIPVRSMGMGGGGMMGGGMMGGGMMGGGMGGGGMMGGMGGGGMGGGMMGGMGGGMGGGMFSVADELPAEPAGFQAFAVPDDLKLGPKSNSSTAKPAAPARRQGTAPLIVVPNKKPAGRPVAIELAIPTGTDPEAAWSAYLASHPKVPAGSVRETARQLMHGRKFDEVVGLIRAALRSGHPQPWMYEAMSLAMQAGGSSQKEVERALMSAVDFGETSDELLYVAQYMARIGLQSRALKVFRQVSQIEPLRPEPYMYGLQLAERLHDMEGIRWSSLGILKQAWPKEKSALVGQARRAAMAAVEELKRSNRPEEAAALQEEIDRAKIRDCVVKITWTGDADVDIIVEEPSGAVCSFSSPRTSGGGVLVGDNSSQDPRAVGQFTSETYECPEAFAGTYQVLVRRVWGKVTAGKVTVDLYSNYGTPEEKHIHNQIALGDQDSLLVFDLPKGRREEPLSDHQLANAAAGQLAVNQAILAQQLGQIANSQTGANATLGAARQDFFGIPFIRQAVGYQPVITTLPSGTRLMANGVVSADRRYVRVSPMPMFSGVSNVTTYNLISGTTGSSSGGSSGSIGSSGSGAGQF